MAPNQNQSRVNLQYFIHTVGKPIGETIREYITVRYERWADYSRYKCSQSGLEGEENDVLNEVLLNVLQKDEQLLMKLFRAKKVHKGKEYTELDFFILRALNVNITSETSPYRYKNRPIRNNNIELERLKISDELYNELDKPVQILKEMRLMTWVLKGLDLTESERRVFEHRFLHGFSLCSDYNGPETVKQRYQIYHQIEFTIHNVLFYYGMTDIVPKGKLSGRQSELADRFVRSHRVKKNKQSNQLVNI
jgi:hypothetical protein